MDLGDVIKRKRLEMGMTQSELADGICTQALISRIENNDLIPKKDILDQIEERLQLEENELTLVYNLNTNQNKIDGLVAEIRGYLDRREYKSIELLLHYNESLIESTKNINDKSFFKWMNASVVHQLYDNSEEALDILKEIPLDDLENELSTEITNAIGLIYYQNKDFDSALSYFYSGMQKIDDSVNYKVQAKVLFNYALTLEEDNKNYEALSTILSGIELLIENDSLYILGDFYYSKGYIFNKINNSQEALENFELAQAIFKIQNNGRFYDLSQLAISEINNKLQSKEETK